MTHCPICDRDLDSDVDAWEHMSECLEERLNRTVKVGEAVGLEEAAGILMRHATEAFQAGRPEAALLRKLSLDLKTLAEGRHPGSPLTKKR